MIDYHLDLPHSDEGRLTLYTHFSPRIVPGWFDKRLFWRKPAAVNFDRTVLVSPSAAFVGRLPRGRIPDRSDFRTLTAIDRIRAWQDVVVECEALADELHDVLEKDQLASRLQRM